MLSFFISKGGGNLFLIFTGVDKHEPLSQCPRNLSASSPPGGEGPLGALKFRRAGPDPQRVPLSLEVSCVVAAAPSIPASGFPSQSLRTKRPALPRDFLLFLSRPRHPLVLTSWFPGPRPRVSGREETGSGTTFGGPGRTTVFAAPRPAAGHQHHFRRLRALSRDGPVPKRARAVHRLSPRVPRSKLPSL